MARNYYATWNAKGLADGSNSIQEIIDALDEQLSYFKRIQDSGGDLKGEVQDDNAELELQTDHEEQAKRLGFDKW